MLTTFYKTSHIAVNKRTLSVAIEVKPKQKIKKIKNSQNFFSLHWPAPKLILLDSQTCDKAGLLVWAINGSRSKTGSAIWWFGLWGVTPVAARLAKEKLCTLSILRRSIRIFTTFEGSEPMSKRELIDYIREINRSAKPEFLASFSEEDLNAYLEHLMELDLEELVVCS